MPGCLKVIHFLLLLYHSFKSNFTRFDGSIYLFERKSIVKIFYPFQLKYELDQPVVYPHSDFDKIQSSIGSKGTELV